MMVKALQVSLNGTVLYTVGIENWRALRTDVHGSKHPKEFFANEETPEGAELPEEGVESLSLYASVAVESGEAAKTGSFKTSSYESHRLTVGDEVTIRVIETDKPDKPNAPDPQEALQIARAQGGVATASEP